MKKLLIAVCLFPLMSKAQNNDSIFIKKISNEVLLNGKAYDLLKHLTKQIGARLAGSEQATKAEQWGFTTLKNLGADTVFFQECEVPNWKRGNGDAVTIIGWNNKKVNKPLTALALGNSNGTTAPVVANVLVIESFEELEQRKDEVKGKIVYFNAAFNATNIRPFKSYGETGIYRRMGASRAAKYGAVAIMIRSLTEAPDNYAHTGTMTYNDSFPKIPAVALGNQDADFIAVEGKKSILQISLHTHGVMLENAIGRNVVAELKGSENNNQFITIGGHLDSWDVGEGAHDDGAGIVQTMEVLRVLKTLGYTPKRTIRFVLFANEENGLKGGLKYAELAKKNNEQHVFALESDAGGFTPRGFTCTAPAAKLAAMQAWIKLLQPYGVSEIIIGGGGSDIGPLNKNFGTPVAGFMPDAQRYFDIHHTKNDVFEAVNKRELLLGAINMAALIYLVDSQNIF
jgi:carboxypeptidase Q